MEKEANQIDHIVSKLGEKIKLLRIEKSLSLRDLSSKSGISAAAIHKLESNGMTPTITTMMKIADALERNVSYFIEEEGNKDVVFIPVTKREPILTFKKGLDLKGISAKQYGDFIMTAAYATVEVGASSGRTPMQHRGEELIYCLRGKIEFSVQDEVYVLDPGDSINFRTNLKHRWKNIGDRQAKLIWVLAVPPS